jgi:hypothetical protein
MSTTNPISPKVNASAIGTIATGLGLTIVVAALQAVTPEMLESLGIFAPVLFAGISAAGGYLAGYKTRDPLRITE